MNPKTIVILLLALIIVAPIEAFGKPKKKKKYKRKNKARTEVVSNKVVEPCNDADIIIREAKKYIGTPYRRAGRTPKGFDCSGFTKYVFSKFGYKLAPSAPGQYSHGSSVARGTWQRGDLVFFGGRNGSRNIGHVGLVTDVDNEKGKFYFIHSARKGICISSSTEPYYAKRYVGARRIINSNTVSYSDFPVETESTHTTQTTIPTSTEQQYQSQTKKENITEIHRPSGASFSKQEKNTQKYTDELSSTEDNSLDDDNYKENINTQTSVLHVDTKTQTEKTATNQPDDNNFFDEYVPVETMY